MNCRPQFFSVAAFCITLLASITLSQTQLVGSKQIAKKGWLVPRVKNLQVKETTELDVKGQNVTRYLYRFVDPKPFVYPTKYRYCEFPSLIALAIKNKIFAIGGDCYAFGVDPRYGKFYIGAVTAITFYDEDGDGRFETRYTGPLVKVFIPERLRDKSIPATNPSEQKPPPLISKPALKSDHLLTNSLNSNLF